MKFDDSALSSAVMCFLISGAASYFIFTHDIKVSAIIGTVVGLVMYCVVASRRR
jgi:hypothetical protein